MDKQYELYFGRLGKNPDLRYTPKQKAVCYLSLAINKINQEKPEWKRIIVWGKQAELCSLYLKKGKEVFVQGLPKRVEFTNKDGEKKSYDEVNARLIGFSNI